METLWAAPSLIFITTVWTSLSSQHRIRIVQIWGRGRNKRDLGEHLGTTSPRPTLEPPLLRNSVLQLYSAFYVGYLHRQKPEPFKCSHDSNKSEPDFVSYISLWNVLDRSAAVLESCGYVATFSRWQQTAMTVWRVLQLLFLLSSETTFLVTVRQSLLWLPRETWQTDSWFSVFTQFAKNKRWWVSIKRRFSLCTNKKLSCRREAAMFLSLGRPVLLSG